MTRPRSFFGWLFRLVLLAIVLTALFTGVAGYEYFRPYRGFGTEAFVDIERGLSSREIARLLAAQVGVRSPSAFLAVRALHPKATL